jgi:hypothetical protein
MTAELSVMPVTTSDLIQTPKNLSATTVASLNDFSPFNDILEPNDTQKAIWAYIALTYPETTLLLESNPSMHLETTCDNNSFPKFHRMIYELIRFWAKTDAAQYYSFYEIWETWDGVIIHITFSSCATLDEYPNSSGLYGCCAYLSIHSG